MRRILRTRRTVSSCEALSTTTISQSSRASASRHAPMAAAGVVGHDNGRAARHRLQEARIIIVGSIVPERNAGTVVACFGRELGDQSKPHFPECCSSSRGSSPTRAASSWKPIGRTCWPRPASTRTSCRTITRTRRAACCADCTISCAIRRPSCAAWCRVRCSTSRSTFAWARRTSASGSARRCPARTMLQLYIPKGFAHGFVVRSETADFLYKCSDYYRRQRRSRRAVERSGDRHRLGDARPDSVRQGQALSSAGADRARPVAAVPAMSLRLLITGA